MTSLEILSAFLTSFLISKKRNVCFINSPLVFMYKTGAIVNSKVTYIDLEDNYSPVAPFLQIIKDAKPDSKTIEKCVYPLMKPAFKGYISTGTANEPDEDSLAEETFYEKIKCRNSIVELLKNIRLETYVILNCQNLSLEAIEIIKEIENSEINGKFIFSFDINKTDYSDQRLFDFYQYLQSNKKFIQFYDNDTQFQAPKKENSKKTDFNQLVSEMKNLRCFKAVDQSLSLCSKAIKWLENVKLSPEQKRIFYFELGLSYYYSSDSDSASLYFNLVINSGEEDEIYIHSLIYLANTYLMRRMNQKATKFATLAIQKLHDKKDSNYYAYALRVIYNACDRINTDSLVENFFNACDALKSHKLWNNYCITASNVPTCFLEDFKGLKEKIIPLLEDSAEILRRLKNEFTLSEICNVLGFIHSRFGNQEESSKWYNESTSLRMQIGQIKSIIGVKNSLSYEYLIAAKYKESFETLNSFMPKITELDNYAAISDTLRNVALPLFYDRDYDTASKLLQLLLFIIKIFDFANNASNSYVPEVNDLMIYKTVINIARDDFKHAEFSYYNIINSSNKHYSFILKPFLYYINSSIMLKKGDFKKAIENFEEGFILEGNEETSESKDHTNVFILYEFARTLKKFGYDEKSDEYFQRGFQLAKEKNFTYYTKGRTSITLEEFDSLKEEFEPLKLNISYMKSRAEKDKLTNDLHDKIIDAQFTNKIMSFSSQNLPLKKYISEVLKAILDFTAADSVVYIEKNGDEWQNISVTFNNEKITLPETGDYYFNLSSDKSIVFDNISKCYFSNLSKFKYQNGIVLIPNSKNQINGINAEPLNIAFATIQNEITMKKQQETLLQASTIDPLTKLKNRGTLMEYIADSSEKIKRSFKRKNTKHQVTICFIDLDNFKFYNDNFNHNTGDFLLKRFAELLMNNYRRVDCLARFGGDEFIVVLPETTCENAGILAERLYENLRLRENFVPELEKFLDKKLNILNSRKLSFSMGICSNFEIEDSSDLNEVIKHADEALYISKQSGKSRYTIWNKNYEQKS